VTPSPFAGKIEPWHCPDLVDTEPEATMSPTEVFTMSRKRRQFTDEFKAEVVHLVNNSDKSFSQVCRDLELTPSAVTRWVKQASVGSGQDSSRALTRDERSELTPLRRENKTLRMEREVLKKATAFFVKESN